MEGLIFSWTFRKLFAYFWASPTFRSGRAKHARRCALGACPCFQYLLLLLSYTEQRNTPTRKKAVEKSRATRILQKSVWVISEEIIMPGETPTHLQIFSLWILWHDMGCLYMNDTNCIPYKSWSFLIGYAACRLQITVGSGFKSMRLHMQTISRKNFHISGGQNRSSILLLPKCCCSRNNKLFTAWYFIIITKILENAP